MGTSFHGLIWHLCFLSMNCLFMYLYLLCNSIVYLSNGVCLSPKSSSQLEPNPFDCIATLDTGTKCEFVSLGVPILLFPGILSLAFLMVTAWVKLFSMTRECSCNLQKERRSQKWCTWEIRDPFQFSTSVRVWQMKYEFQNVPTEEKNNVLCFCLSRLQMLLTLSPLRKVERACQIFQLVSILFYIALRKGIQWNVCLTMLGHCLTPLIL